MDAPFHIFEMQQWDAEGLDELFERTLYMQVRLKSHDTEFLRGFKAVNLFYQPSTRTHASFCWAERSLGMEIMFDTDSAGQTSSAIKGESLEDTIETHADYSEDSSRLFIVLRHPHGNAAEIAVRHASGAHIINAGCGKASGQHPTQTCLDYFTMRSERPGLHAPKIGFFGDMRNGRTVRSAAYIAPKAWPGCELYFVSPPSLRMMDDVLDHLTRHEVRHESITDTDLLKDVLSVVDVCYMTRFQQEDLVGEDLEHFNDYQLAFQLSPERMQILKSDALVLHPRPRNQELPRSIDADPRVADRRQSKNGKPVRMALIQMMAEATQPMGVCAAL